MYRIALLNLGFLISVLVPLLPSFFPDIFSNVIIANVIIAAGIFWCVLYLAAAAFSIKAISDYGSFGFGVFFKNIKTAIKPALCMGGVIIILTVMMPLVIIFYLNMKSWLGLFLAALIFWLIVTVVFSLQWFFAIRARLDSKILKAFKKSFIIFFDNTGFSIFTLLFGFVFLILSGILAFLVPGPAGVILFLDEALRLRLLKYDWLEANPDPTGSRKKRKIPWDVILIEEREKTGSRTFRNFIFPWKD
jgi:hypothetical protein